MTRCPRRIGLLPALATALLLASGLTAVADPPRLLVAGDLSIGRQPQERAEAFRKEMQTRLESAATAASTENLEHFLGHFTESTARRMRRRLAMLFVTHEVSLEILDCQVMNCRDERAELAVQYRVGLSHERADVVARLQLTRIDGDWRINAERVQSIAEAPSSRFNSGGPAGCGVLGGCAGGRCPVD